MVIVDDDMKDVDYFSILNSLNSNPTEESFSLEDVAWADSCLTKDMDSPKSDWSSMKDALFEIVVSQGLPSVRPSGDESLHFGESVVDDDFIDVKSTQSSEDEDDYFLNKHGRLKGKKCVGNVFRPSYTEDIVAGEKLDSGLDPTFLAYDVGPTSDNIFQVWNLRIPDEQDDFAYQLNNVFDEVPPQTRSTYENSSSQEDPMDASVDSLITAIGGLSLVPHTK